MSDIINVKQRQKEREASRLANRTPEQVLEDRILEEINWVNSELKRTDRMASIKDHPNYNATVYYRVALRSYLLELETEGFTEFNQPVLDETIKNALTKYQFKIRLTKTERKDIKRISRTNEDIEDWLDLFNSTEEIDLSDPETIAGINALEQMGILIPGRAAQILL